MTTTSEIRQWFEQGQFLKKDYMIIVCDTYDHEDYPLYTTKASFWEQHKQHNGVNMQQIMEVYDLNMDMEAQLTPGTRVNNCPPRPAPPVPGYVRRDPDQVHVIMEYNGNGQVIRSHAAETTKVVNKIVAWGSKDGNWVRAEDKELRPDKDRFTIPFYGGI